MKSGHKLRVFSTENGTKWTFEVYDWEGSLLGQGTGFTTKKDAKQAGNKFSDWYFA